MKRPVRLGFNSVVTVVLFGTILGVVNFLAVRHNVRWDFSETKKFTLAPQTARSLRELPREVKATVFTSDQGPARMAYRDLFETYKAFTPKLTVEFVDPEKKPGLARRYGITRIDTAVLESGKQETRITSATEQELTNAILRVTKDDKKMVYFLTGHGEHALDDATEGGYSFFKEALERQGYTVRTLSLYDTKTVPANASVLVIGGPQQPMPAAEQSLIADYVNNGGRVLVMWDPASRADLEPLLANWGLKSDNRAVMDEQRIIGGDLTMPVVNNYGPHEITKNFRGIFTVFPFARPVSFQDAKAAEWQYEVLAKSSARSWASPIENGQIKDFDPNKGTAGPVALASVVTRKVSKRDDGGDADNRRKPAVVFIGDSDLAGNAFLNLAPGNSDFMLHAVAWLAEEKGLVTIAPKDTAFGTFLLTASQSNALFSLQVLVLPSFLLAVGFVVWQRRRRL